MIVGVWDNKRNLSYTKGHGFANINSKIPMNPEMYFRIGSNTKSFVITIILQLVDEKQISLEDKLSKYLPDFPRADEVTIRMLCDMSSGIYNYTETPEFDDKLENEPLHKWTVNEMIDLAKKYDYYFDPGTDAHYSNTNTAILGFIAEKITGNKLENLVKTRLFDVYNLKNTIFAVDNKMPDGPYVSGYGNYTNPDEYTDDVTTYFDVSWAWAAGAMISNVYDVKKWVELLIDGGMISDTLQQQRFVGKTIGNGTVTYGLGIYKYTGIDMWGHNGGLPGYTSVMMRDKTNDRTIVIFYNVQGSPAPEPLFMSIEKLLR
jgi:D-alanyl-D-alanine carboxypeptidase